MTGEFGQLVGTISARDVRVMLRENRLYRLLHTPLHSFISLAHLDTKNIVNPAIICNKRDTVQGIFGKMLSAKVHRLFLTDDDMVPIRVISFGDLLDRLIVVPQDWAIRHRIDENGLNFVDRR